MCISSSDVGGFLSGLPIVGPLLGGGGGSGSFGMLSQVATAAPAAPAPIKPMASPEDLLSLARRSNARQKLRIDLQTPGSGAAFAGPPTIGTGG